jgi:phage terminase large subunit-like protein
MMKRMICTLAALAMLIWTCPPAQAEFKGRLQRDLDWTLDVDNSSTTGETAVTVRYLSNRRNENEISSEEIEIGLVPGSERVQLFFSKPARNVRRIIIEVDPPTTATIIPLDINQNGSIAVTIQGRLVFDVVD